MNILKGGIHSISINFPCSADHEQDWQPYPVDPYSAICGDHTYIHKYIQVYPGHFYCMSWSSLVEMTGDDNSAAADDAECTDSTCYYYYYYFPHISPISRTRGHRRRLPFPYHRYIQKHK